MATEAPNGVNRNQVEIGKLFAEIMNLVEDSRKKEDEREMLRAEAAKMQAEILKIHTETKWHSFYKVALWWGSAFAAAAAVIKFSNTFLK